MRAHRSWMFVPGNKQRFLDKAAGLDVDVVLFDLEDGVPPEAKPLARSQIAEAIRAAAIPAKQYVRVNGVGSRWFLDDLAAVCDPRLHGLCLPKVETPRQVAQAAHRLRRYEVQAGLRPGSIRLVLAIESANGLLRAREIASASNRVDALLLGAEDLALDIGLSALREQEARELLYARSTVVVAARATGVLAVDGVYPDYQDLDGLREDAGQARRLGFDGKSLFHPGQIAEINRLFSPAPEEVAYAEKVVAAFDEAQRRGDGAVAVGGQLVDLPIVRRAQTVLDLARQFAN